MYISITSWKEHIKKKKVELDLKLSKMYWLIGRKSVLYNQVIKPVWTCGIQLWGCTSQENIETIQRFHNKVLRMILTITLHLGTYLTLIFIENSALRQ